ncbi:MAG: hypothetical protein ABEH59_01545 [Halobacteriales archaeon]
MTVEEDCPICNSSSTAKEPFAAAMVAEHIKEKARHDEDHQEWIEDHTEAGTLAEIREAL